MSEEHSETLSDHLQRIRKLEEEARAKHDKEMLIDEFIQRVRKEKAREAHDREMLIDEDRESLRNRVNSLEEKIRHLEQDISMIKFDRRHNR